MECILEIILINIEENIIYLNLKKKIYDKQSNFLKEELELITKLRITKKISSIFGLYPNLKEDMKNGIRY